jgi:hypothetical protein
MLSAAPTKPRCGGGSKPVFWTGGSDRVKSAMKLGMKTPNAKRNTENDRSQQNVWNHVAKGLTICSPNHILKLHRSKDDTTMIEWIGEVALMSQKYGVDPVFRIIDKYGIEHNVMDTNEFSYLNTKNAEVFAEDLSKTGVVDKDGLNRLPVCPFDLENLQLSGDMLKNSIDDDLYKSVIASCGTDDWNGIEAFAHITRQASPRGFEGYEKAVSNLRKLRLKEHPNEDVTSFVTIVKRRDSLRKVSVSWQ